MNVQFDHVSYVIFFAYTMFYVEDPRKATEEKGTGKLENSEDFNWNNFI